MNNNEEKKEKQIKEEGDFNYLSSLYVRKPPVQTNSININLYYLSLSTLVDEENGEGNQTPSTNATPMVAKITELERQMLNEKLVLVDEHGNPLKRKVMNEASASKLSTSMGDQLEKFDYDEVELPDDKTSRYMSSTGGGVLCEDDLDFYDGYEAPVYDLPKQM
ncbi:hypothetical protein Tco_0982673 [Tanacetum coccineum]